MLRFRVGVSAIRRPRPSYFHTYWPEDARVLSFRFLRRALPAVCRVSPPPGGCAGGLPSGEVFTKDWLSNLFLSTETLSVTSLISGLHVHNSFHAPSSCSIFILPISICLSLKAWKLSLEHLKAFLGKAVFTRHLTTSSPAAHSDFIHSE